MRTYEWLNNSCNTRHQSYPPKPHLHDTTCYQTGCQTGLTTGFITGCIVYTAGCQTGYTTRFDNRLNEQTVRSTRLSNGLSNRVVQLVSNRVVQPVWQPAWQPVGCLFTRYSRFAVWQPVVSCNRGFSLMYWHFSISCWQLNGIYHFYYDGISFS